MPVIGMSEHCEGALVVVCGSPVVPGQLLHEAEFVQYTGQAVPDADVAELRSSLPPGLIEIGKPRRAAGLRASTGDEFRCPARFVFHEPALGT
jgi:hypothetical protein